MKQKLELLNNLGCHYIINNVIYKNVICKSVSADLFIDTISYPVEIKFYFNGTGYVHAHDSTTIIALEELLKKNNAKIVKFRKQKIIIFILEFIIFVECVRNIIFSVGQQFQSMHFDTARTAIAFICTAILWGMFRINLIAKNH